MKLLALPGLLAVLTSTALTAQTQQFEVASIKPTSPDGQHRISINFQPGGRFVATGITAKLLIQEAFDIRDSQISGGPSWLDSEGFDINAKATVEETPGETRNGTPEQRAASMSVNRLRLQALLTERFHLKFHRDTREQQVFALVVGKNGVKMKQSPESGKGPNGFRISRGALEGNQATMDLLAEVLARPLSRTVINKTGLAGNWEVKLEWTPDPGQTAGSGPDAPPQANDAPGPSIFSALQEQLGLRLESTKAPVEQFIVDSVEKPSEN